MKYPNRRLQRLASFRRLPVSYVVTTPSTQWHHRCQFVAYAFSAPDMPGSLAAHAESGDINSLLIDTHFAFDMFVEPAEFPGIPCRDRFHWRHEDVAEKASCVLAKARIGFAIIVT